MPTIRQKNLAEEIVANAKRPKRKQKNKKEMLVSAGYDVTTAEKTPGRTLEQAGVKEALREYGLNEELITKALVADIKAKPKRREKELRLGAEILGMKHDDKRPPQQNNIFIFNDERAAKIARRVIGGTTTGSTPSEESPS